MTRKERDRMSEQAKRQREEQRLREAEAEAREVPPPQVRSGVPGVDPRQMGEAGAPRQTGQVTRR